MYIPRKMMLRVDCNKFQKILTSIEWVIQLWNFQEIFKQFKLNFDVSKPFRINVGIALRIAGNNYYDVWEGYDMWLKCYSSLKISTFFQNVITQL